MNVEKKNGVKSSCVSKFVSVLMFLMLLILCGAAGFFARDYVKTHPQWRQTAFKPITNAILGKKAKTEADPQKALRPEMKKRASPNFMDLSRKGKSKAATWAKGKDKGKGMRAKGKGNVKTFICEIVNREGK